MSDKPKTIDEYLATMPEDKRAALQGLRENIRASAPKAVECIGYGLPGFRQNKMLVGFGATASHCAFYLWSGETLQGFKTELKGYDASKGTIRFQADDPLPEELVRKLVRARIAENER